MELELLKQRTDSGFTTHYCPIHKEEYPCLAVQYGCDYDEWEQTCNTCLGIQIGVDFISHMKIKDVENRSPCN